MPANWRDHYQVLRTKYEALVTRYNNLVQSSTRTRSLFRRLYRNYQILKHQYSRLYRKSSSTLNTLVDRLNNERYPLVLDEYRRVVKVSRKFLDLVGMSLGEFQASVYLDILFDKYLPPPERGSGPRVIEPFSFPVMIEDYDLEGQAMHPFVHFQFKGRLAWDGGARAYRYWLAVEDVSSNVELDYLQKTDRTIQRLTVSNLELQKAKKHIDVHKKMLLSLTTSLVGAYSKETSSHLTRMQVLTEYLSQACRQQGLIQVADYDPDEFVKDVNYTSVLHDIGKMGVPASILNKAGALSPEEQEIMHRHPLIGAEYIQKIIDEFSRDPRFTGYGSFLRIPYDICRSHHEHWDGSGYPDGLKGEEIPVAARIVAIADTYDAIRGERPYHQESRSHAEAMQVLITEAGRQFDPRLVEAAISIQHKFESLYQGAP